MHKQKSESFYKTIGILISFIVYMYVNFMSMDYNIPEEGMCAKLNGLGFVIVASFFFFFFGYVVHLWNEIYGIKYTISMWLRVFIYTSLLLFFVQTIKGEYTLLFESSDIRLCIIYLFVFSLIGYLSRNSNAYIVIVISLVLILFTYRLPIIHSNIRLCIISLPVFLLGYRIQNLKFFHLFSIRIFFIITLLLSLVGLLSWDFLTPITRYVPVLTSIFQGNEVGGLWILLFLIISFIIMILFGNSLSQMLNMDPIDNISFGWYQRSLIERIPQLFIMTFVIYIFEINVYDFLPFVIFLVVIGVLSLIGYIIIIKIPLKYIGGSFIARDFFRALYSNLNNLNDKLLNNKKNKKILLFLIYSFSFLFVGFMVFSVFLQKGRSLLWYPDGAQSYFESMVFYRSMALELMEKWRENHQFVFPMFDFSISLGKDVTARILGIFIEPFNFLAMFCPYEKIEYLMDIRTIVYCYLTGLFYVIYYNYITEHIKIESSICGALVYAFCGYALFGGIRHPVMQLMMVLYPVVLIAIENVIRKKSCIPLIVIVFYGCISEIYSFYIVSIIAVIYVVIRYMCLYRKNGFKSFIITIIRCIIGYLIGFLMAGIVWIPKILYVYLPSGRVGSTSHIVVDNLGYYSIDYYKLLWTNLMGGHPYIDLWTVVGLPATLIICIVLLWQIKEQHIRWIKWELLIFTILLLIPAFGYITSGFSSISNRWSFGFAFICALIISTVLDNIVQFDKKGLGLSVFLVVLYNVILILIAKKNISFGVLASVICSFLMILILLMLFIMNKVHYYKIGIMGITVISIVFNAFYLYSSFGENYAAQFIASNETLKAFTDEGFISLAQYIDERGDYSFYRCNSNTISLDSNGCAKMLHLNGLSGFNSAEVVYNNYLIESENSGIYDSTVRLGMDNRYIPLELACVKYMVVDGDNQKMIPYNYEIKKVVGNEDGNITYISENNNPLSIGYTYDSYITREAYEQLNPVEKQEIMLKSVVLDGKYEEALIPNNLDNDYICNIKKLTGLMGNNIDWSNGNLYVGPGGGTLKINFERTTNKSEVYVRLIGYETERATWTVTASCAGVHTSSTMTSRDNLYSTATDGRIINLGYHPYGLSEIILGFDTQGNYGLKEIEIWEVPVSQYDSLINQLKEEELKDVIISNNKITGTIEVDSDKFLCLSIPNSSIQGWRAYVDDIEVELKEANSLYMGLWLTKGQHEIRMEYCEPGLKQGVLVSSIGFGLLFLYIIVLLILLIIDNKKKGSDND